MRTRARFPRALLAAAIVLAAVAARADDEADVRAAAAQFYVALNAIFRGDVEPMQAIWSHADDVTYLGPDGALLVGWERTLGSWTSQASLRLGGEVRAEHLHVMVGDDLAVVQNREIGGNRSSGSPVPVRIRATSVFRKQEGAWKMVSHHTDLLPFIPPADPG